jgi:hypothetical protein
MKEAITSSHTRLELQYEPDIVHLAPSNPQQLFLNSDYVSGPCSFPEPSTSIPSQQNMTVPALNNSIMAPPIGPLPSSKHDNQMRGMYSNSGFDMLSVLARLANR